MLRLVEPSLAYESQVMAYKRAFLASGDDLEKACLVPVRCAWARLSDISQRFFQTLTAAS